MAGVAAVAEVVVVVGSIVDRRSVGVGADIPVQYHKVADHTHSEDKRTWNTAPTEDWR